AYLDIARRLENFSLVSGALVRRVAIRNGAAVGVEYERRGRTHTATARREIVLSSGAYGTPHCCSCLASDPPSICARWGSIPYSTARSWGSISPNTPPHS